MCRGREKEERRRRKKTERRGRKTTVSFIFSLSMHAYNLILVPREVMVFVTMYLFLVLQKFNDNSKLTGRKFTDME